MTDEQRGEAGCLGGQNGAVISGRALSPVVGRERLRSMPPLAANHVHGRYRANIRADRDMPSEYDSRSHRG